MNFGKTVKQEIASKPPKDKCCKKAFLSGVIRGASKLVEKDGNLALEITIIGEEAETLIRSYLSMIYGYEVRTFKTVGGRAKELKTILTIEGEELYTILIDLGVFTDNGTEVSVNLNMYEGIKKECCIRSFIKGLFLSSGGCTVPSERDSKNTRYHLEINFSSPVAAEQTARILLERGVQTRIMRRKSNYVIYIKSVEEINNFFAFIGTPISVLKLTDLVATKEFVNNINRQQNCELANMDKQIEASGKQISAIKKIESIKGLEYLKNDLRAVAEARLSNPEDTLPQLAEKLGITKSCINHRLRKIVEIANEL